MQTWMKWWLLLRSFRVPRSDLYGVQPSCLSVQDICMAAWCCNEFQIGSICICCSPCQESYGALQVTHHLFGENYVFWGGREGDQSLLNTDMERELNHWPGSWMLLLFTRKRSGLMNVVH